MNATEADIPAPTPCPLCGKEHGHEPNCRNADYWPDLVAAERRRAEALERAFRAEKDRVHELADALAAAKKRVSELEGK